MTSRHMIAAAAFALMGSAAMASPTVFTDMPSTQSRAVVKAELDAARHDSSSPLAASGDSYGVLPPVLSTETTREAVLAEVSSARASGELDARDETYGDIGHAQFGHTAQSATSTAAFEVPLQTGTDYSTVQPQMSHLALVESEPAEATLFRANDNYAAAPLAVVADAGITREQVLNELVNARASGEFDARGETSGDLGNTKFGNLPQQDTLVIAEVPVAYVTNANPVDASGDDESVVLWVPADGEAVTLQPGEILLLVPAQSAEDMDGE